MADFKKIDDDAVAADEPLDSYVLKRAEENIRAVRVERPRRYSWGWPTHDQIERPKIACHKDLAYLLGRWPVTPGVRQVRVRLRYKVYKTSVHIGVGLLTAGGVSIGDLTQKATGTYDDEFTVNVERYSGDVADLLLVIRSDSINPVSESYSNYACIINTYRIDADTGAGTSFPWTSGDRWALEFLPPSGVSDSQDGDSMPISQTVAWVKNYNNDNAVYIYPGYAFSNAGLNGWQGGSYRIQVSELGYAEMYGVAVEEIQNEFDSLENSFLTGRTTSAAACSALYQEERRFFVEQTRIHHFGPSYDNQFVAPSVVTGQPVLQWGEMREHDTDWQPLVSCMAGRYDKSSLSGVTRERSSIRISGFLQAIAREPDEYIYTIRARLISFNPANAVGPIWDPDMGGADTAVYSDEIDVVVSARAANANLRDPQGALLGMSNDTGVPSYHYLRGALDYPDLDSPTAAGLTPFSLTIKETTPLTFRRLLEIQIKGVSPTASGTPVATGGFSDGLQTGVVCPAWTAWTEGVTSGI